MIIWRGWGVLALLVTAACNVGMEQATDAWYGIPEGMIFGFPVTCENGEYKIVEGLEIDAFSQERINITLAELQGEQDGVKHLL